MAKAARKKPKAKSPKFSDHKQSERFVEAARKLGIEETDDKFKSAVDRIVRSKPQ